MVSESFGFEAEGGHTKSAAHGTLVGRVKSFTANTPMQRARLLDEQPTARLLLLRLLRAEALPSLSGDGCQNYAAKLELHQGVNDGNYSWKCWY